MADNIAIVTVSDTCSADPTKDASGPVLTELIKHLFPNAQIKQSIVLDDKDIIEKKLIQLCDSDKTNLILTTGGTGLSKRDVTPEATRSVIHRDVPSISTAIAIESLKITPMAMLSRAVAGVRNQTLIINFPGSKKAVIECFDIVKPVLSHAIALIGENLSDVKSTHSILQGGDHVCPHGIVKSNVDMLQVAFRPRESPYPMIEMDEAYRLIDEIMGQWVIETEYVSTEEGLGRVVAEDVMAMEPLPPFPASVKDGYACLSADGAGVRRVRTALTAGEAAGACAAAGEAAGACAGALRPGDCARVTTGSALPPGADCVVQVEDTVLISASDDGRTEFSVEIMVEPKPGQDVRPVGTDVPLGAVLALRGAVLDAALVGVLAGAGVQKIRVNGRPKVALLSTGNELQDPGDLVLKPSHVRDSNRTMLKCLLREHGYETIDCGIARDEPNELVATMSTALTNADILVCTGGVSMGERDLLKPVLLNDFGGTLHFGRVRMKPGKPSTFVTCNFNGRKKYIFALPGNPVSAYVCCLLLVVRALRHAEGRRAGWPRLQVLLARAHALDPRPEYARAALRAPPAAPGPAAPIAELLGNQASSRLLSACGAGVLLELPGASGACAELPAGAAVQALVTARLDY